MTICQENNPINAALSVSNQCAVFGKFLKLILVRNIYRTVVWLPYVLILFRYIFTRFDGVGMQFNYAL